MAQRRASHVRELAKTRLTVINATLTVCTALLTLSSCTHSASQQFLAKATSYGFEEITIPTQQFTLQAYQNRPTKKSKSNVLHVYLTGDGVPFFRGSYINKDPTPRNGLALELMALDSAPSVLIGRPCYHLELNTPPCENPKWWTTHRYSPEIVDALAQAIDDYAGSSSVTLIGFSGGGALATLLTQKITNIHTVIGINPNLDIDAWTTFHGYTPLTGSLNPVDASNWSANDVRILFLTGENDNNVPAHLWQEHYQERKNIQIERYDGFTHTCCWPEIWRKILATLPD